MSTADVIYELVKQLPEEEANIVLMFAEFVQQHTKPENHAGRSSLMSSFGILKDSPTFNESPFAMQGQMRDEWD